MRAACRAHAADSGAIPRPSRMGGDARGQAFDLPETVPMAPNTRRRSNRVRDACCGRARERQRIGSAFVAER